MVTLETLLQLDNRVWPVACMVFLRVVTLFSFLPIFGDSNVPIRVRIALSIFFSFILWPSISGQPHYQNLTIAWDPLTSLLYAMREVFIGFSMGFSARILMFAVSIASQMVGVNMGFQSATLFSPTTGTQESSYAVFKGWIVTLCLFVFQIHHLYLREIFHSFELVPVGSLIGFGDVATSASSVVQSSFLLGIRLGAPLLLVQFLVTLALGLVNRTVPQLNALVMQFPLSFLVSFLVLLFTGTAFVRLIGTQGLLVQTKGLSEMTSSLGGK